MARAKGTASAKSNAFRGRLDMRLSPDQEALLRAASSLVGESLTAFVLGAATERAEELLDRANRIEVSRPAFDRFVTTLYRPTSDRQPSDMPRVRFYGTPTRIPQPSSTGAKPAELSGGGA